MTPEHLQRALAAVPPGTWPSLDRPEVVLRAVEAAAEARPTDRRLATLVRQVHRLANASRGLSPIVAGVRRERLVRWDEESTTWSGVRIGTGQPALVRVLRPELDDPVLRRALARDARALAAVLDGVTCEGPALWTPAPGAPLDALEVDVARAARMVGSAIGSLWAYDKANIGLPVLTEAEVRVAGDHVDVVCLSPTLAPDAGANLQWLAGRVKTDESALTEVLAGMIELPPRTAEEAAAHWRKALGTHLTGNWHALRLRWHRTAHHDRVARLHGLTARLTASLPPPTGRAAVGVDLEGRVTIVRSDGRELAWGPAHQQETVWSPDKGVDAPTARRLLRARAAAPPNPRLNAEVGGDPAFTEAVCRWLGSALRLRTVRLLLEKSLEDGRR